MAAMAAQYSRGDEVYVFYRMCKRCQPNRRYLAVLDPRHGAYRPRHGISDGWVPARVVQDHDPSKRGAEVCVEYRWPHFYTMRGHLADAGSDPWTEWYRLASVRPAADFPAPGPGHCLVPPGSQPELAIIAFRWGGINEVVAAEQWGDTGSSASDMFMEAFIEMAAAPQLGTGYEVWTVYIEDHSDMVKIADAAHMIFGQNHPCRRAKRTCAMYFLYPTGFEENCIPTMETGEDHGAALVDQKSLFRLMKSVERAGITTRFPHPSGFYEQLTSKRWTHLLSVVPHLRVPATVALPRMLIERSIPDAARKGIAALEVVRKQQAELRKEPPPKTPLVKGVAKLSFSWEALDVKLWERAEGLEDALTQLTQRIEISQELTGQPHDCEAILLQEYIPHDLELRVYVVEGVVECFIYTKFCRIKENLEFGDFKQLFSKAEAAKQWMGGDLAALESGERQCCELTNHWLAWCQAQLAEMPPAIRFDYFVVRGAQAGQAAVWTLEICELGFSMLGEKKLPSKVFNAMLRSCLGDSSSSIGGVEPSPAAAVPPTPPRPDAVAAPKRRRRRRTGKPGEQAAGDFAEAPEDDDADAEDAGSS